MMATPRLLVTAETPERKTLSLDHLLSDDEIRRLSKPEQRRLLAQRRRLFGRR